MGGRVGGPQHDLSQLYPQLRMDVARCKPIAQSLDNVEAIACDHILDSMVRGVTRIWGGR